MNESVDRYLFFKYEWTIVVKMMARTVILYDILEMLMIRLTSTAILSLSLGRRAQMPRRRPRQRLSLRLTLGLQQLVKRGPFISHHYCHLWLAVTRNFESTYVSYIWNVSHVPFARFAGKDWLWLTFGKSSKCDTLAISLLPRTANTIRASLFLFPLQALNLPWRLTMKMSWYK